MKELKLIRHGYGLENIIIDSLYLNISMYTQSIDCNMILLLVLLTYHKNVSI